MPAAQLGGVSGLTPLKLYPQLGRPGFLRWLQVSEVSLRATEPLGRLTSCSSSVPSPRMIRRQALSRPESTAGGMVAWVTVTPRSPSHQCWLFLNKTQGKLGKERRGKAVACPGAEGSSRDLYPGFLKTCSGWLPQHGSSGVQVGCKSLLVRVQLRTGGKAPTGIWSTANRNSSTGQPTPDSVHVRTTRGNEWPRNCPPDHRTFWNNSRRSRAMLPSLVATGFKWLPGFPGPPVTPTVAV